MKEKAEKLIAKFTAHAIGDSGEQVWINAKNCAIICCDEVIKELELHWNEFDEVELFGSSNPILPKIESWQAIKNELEK